MLARIWRKGNLYKLLARMHNGAVTMENSMEGSQNTSIRPSGPIFGFSSKKKKTKNTHLKTLI